MTWSEGGRWARALVALGGALLAGCGGEGSALAGRMDQLVADGRFTVAEAGAGEQDLCFSAPPQLQEVGLGGERRRAVVTPLGSWSWRGTVPRRARLVLGASAADGQSPETLQVTVTAVTRHRRQVVAHGSAAAGEGIYLAVDLSRFAGRELELRARAEGVDGAEGGDRVAWGPVHVLGVPGAQERPNIVLVVVDTLRADRLGLYGNPRPTSRRVEELLARPGVVLEHAYAPSPWTLPSVVSLLASRWPGELLGQEIAAYGLPSEAPALPELLRQAGYATGGFSANPVVHEGSGFGRGFETFYAPRDHREGFEELHADRLAGRALRWLRGQGDRPFFLYAHFLDPHDPYENPDVPAGARSPFYRGYRGTLTGRHVHGVYMGKIPLRDPEEDTRHLTALYDSEVVYADRFLGELLAALPRSVARQTLFVLTSDHGEELHDHGGWKHGRTLYEEQLRVPLVMRWDGVLSAGLRLPGPARLIDLAPTLAAAAGVPAPPEWQGVDLLPALTGERPWPKLPIFAQHLSGGPLRAAAVQDGWKLILFDRHDGFEPPNEHEEILLRQELARLQRVELYHLPSDPGERENLAAREPRQVRRLAPLIHGRLAGHLPGLRLQLSGAPEGEVVRGEVTFEQAPEGWSSYFLGAQDRVEVVGRVLVFTLHGETLEKGVRVEGDIGGVESVRVLSGPALEVVTGSGASLPPEGAPAAALSSSGWPGTPPAPALLLWSPIAAGPPRDEAPDEDNLQRLRALGYAG